jgi:hypothetical protein
MQGYFFTLARGIGWIVCLIALCMAAINYAVNGQGLKDNIIKISKAVIFFFIIMGAYPTIIGTFTKWSFEWAKGAIYSESLVNFFEAKRLAMAEAANSVGSGHGLAYGSQILTDKKISEDKNPSSYFSKILDERTSASNSKITYYTVAPAAALELIMLVAGECFELTKATKTTWLIVLPDFGKMLVGFLCMAFIIFTGVMCLLEYLMAFLEFMFVSSVGIILFPLSLWDGTKFMAEKYISAMIGFFLKLLFCNIWGTSKNSIRFLAVPCS